MSHSGRQVYISYAWGGESERIANEIEADLQARGIAVVRDKRDLGYKGMIQEFMQEIGRGNAVVVVISDKYLKSPNCMFELVEIVKHKDVRDRIFPVVILQDADIYDPVNRIRYIRHWEDRLKQLDKAMRSVSATNLQGLREEIDTYDAIRDHISRLTFMLKDMNTLTPEVHKHSNFSILIASLEERLMAAAALRSTRDAESGSPPATVAVPSPERPGQKLELVPPRNTSAAHQMKSEQARRYEEICELIDRFYQPISARLRRDTAIWEGIKRDKGKPNDIEYRMAFELEMKQIIPNHKEIVSVIDQWRYLVDGDPELSEALDQYLRHVSAFIAIRDTGETWTFPELLGYPWPKNLIPLIENRLTKLRNEKRSLEQRAAQ